MRLESAYDDAARADEREQQRKTVEEAAKDFLGDYRAKHCAPEFVVYVYAP